MRAMVIRQPGGYDAFEAADIADPVAGPGQVRIRVKSSSVNPLELKIRSGAVLAGPAFPAILNADVAGVVDQVGKGIKHFHIGDQVIGCAGGLKGNQGALADLMVVDARLITHAPDKLSLEEAGVLPLVFMTAWSALVERTNIQPGEKVLIQGGTGGVGHVAIQLAKARGAEVHTTVSSAEKAALARQLGADEVINYKEEAVSDYVQRLTGGKGYPVVFDTVGGRSLDDSFQAASLCGRIASINTRSSHDLSLMHGKNLTLHVVFRALPLLTGMDIESEPARLAALTQLVEEGKIKPLLAAERFSFRDVGRAHAYLESGQAIGKILLTHEGI
ncbi:zinc-dependent alcohol dehydrogenase family protein [Marinospirillum alkaliphilum]|uniref:NADPH2:quinone reductase n=1 Tax=Marinospirillum alkaliphilum DSM 21637 TaxID=1122209 RepID=A0A1K1ZVE3_9GAMM|nr:zinc-dependent alcohol dehydrogenase family protein [Marinospirillum alkaliphilum]SFX78234.1 NADPH2:quinone reductase [Marinospirillum alkaliphilum DSM 21637]